MALRPTTGFVESMLRLIGLNWQAPFIGRSSVQHAVTTAEYPAGEHSLSWFERPPCTCWSTAPGSRLKVKARKHGSLKRRARHCPRTIGGHGSRRKLHIGIDAKPLEIRAAECTTSNVGDAPMLPDLLNQIPPEQEIATVTSHGAFAARGAAAIIPPRKNAKPWKADTAGPSPATRSCAPRSGLAAPSGDDRAAITAEAGPKPKCIASSCWASACPPGTSAVRSQSSRSALQS